MGEPWIRVHANLAAKPVVVRAVEALGVSQNEAIGLLVRFWGSVSQHVTDGMVGSHSDVQLEVWGGWTRKRGKFAAFIRAVHLDAEGRVNEWQEYAGVLEEQRRQARSRKRKSLGRDREDDVNSQSIHSEVHEPPHLRDETRRNEIEQQHLQPLTAQEAETEAGLAALLETDADRNALTIVVSRATARGACLASFHSMLTGNDPATPQPTPAEFGQALRDMAGNGQGPSARLMRGYLRDVIAERGRAQRASQPSGANAAKGNTGVRPEHWTDKKAREDAEEAERQLVRMRHGNIEQRRATDDGEAWWRRMQREAKAAGQNATLYGFDRLHEPATLSEAAHA